MLQVLLYLEKTEKTPMKIKFYLLKYLPLWTGQLGFRGDTLVEKDASIYFLFEQFSDQLWLMKG